MFTTYFPKNFTLETPRLLLEPYFDNGIDEIQFNIIDLHAKNACGVAGYTNISFDQKSADISWRWSVPEDADQGLIKHLKFVMMSYGFQVMKLEKITMIGDGTMSIQRTEWSAVKAKFFPELM